MSVNLYYSGYTYFDVNGDSFSVNFSWQCDASSKVSTTTCKIYSSDVSKITTSKKESGGSDVQGYISYTVTCAKLASPQDFTLTFEIDSTEGIKSKTVSIYARTIINAPTLKNGTKKYNDKTQELSSSDFSDWSSISYTISSTSGKYPSSYNATVTCNSEYAFSHYDILKSYTWKIIAADPDISFENVKYKNSLTYNGSAQDLLTKAISSSHASIEYKSSNQTTWSSSIPTATNAGTYTIQYRATGNTVEGHKCYNDIAATALPESCGSQAVINKYKITKPEFEGGSITYDGNAIDLKKRWAFASDTDKSYVKIDGDSSASAVKTYTSIAHIEDTKNCCWSDDTTADISATLEIKAKSVSTPSATTITFGYPAGKIINFTASDNFSYDSTWSRITSDSVQSASEPGTYHVYVELLDTNNTKWSTGGTSKNHIIFTIQSKPQHKITTNPKLASDWTYDASDKLLITTSGASTGTMYYAVNTKEEVPTTWSDTFNSITKLDASTYYIYVKVSGNESEYTELITKIGKVTCSHADLKLIAPIAKELNYISGLEQELCSEAKHEIGDGKIEYSIGSISAAGSSWSTNIPKAMNAGTYYVWYRCKETTNYNKLDAVKIICTISKANILISISPSTSVSMTLNDTKKLTYEITPMVAGQIKAVLTNSSVSIKQNDIIIDSLSKSITINSRELMGASTLVVSYTPENSDYKSVTKNIYINVDSFSNINIFYNGEWKTAYPYVFDGEKWVNAQMYVLDETQKWVLMNSD